ncbi:hypothetical protein APR04_004368 [Promicromonospora umidemergens]|uniref:Mce-associated membrane protein n=1 Tax=Promicromonospora umidemergens TaxID=629679 RepID=A0ABP8XSY9_9MICO|nr:hypothetical protein [Promicromonospora umidemergens]MCP2285436.1 hypothetical protein [Promicromonospora umidemergens]
MVSSAITPTRTIAVLVGVAVIAVAGFAVVRSGVFEPETVQGAIPGPGSSSPSISPPASESPTALPSLTASPKATTPAQIKAKNVADAKARLVEYYETTAQVANNAYEGWSKRLDPYWGHPDVWVPLATSYADLAEQGQYTTGAATVESMSVADYKTSNVGNEEVHLNACVDFRQVRNFAGDGKSIPRTEGAPVRYKFDYVMRHQGLDSIWTVNEQRPHPEQAC